jgi:hypothetical protein
VRRALLIALLAGSAGASAAPTQPAAGFGGQDYSLANTGWNGLSQLQALASSAGMTMVSENELDWKDVGPTDVIYFIYPTARVDAVQLAAFLRRGGRALLADDFGKGDEALARLGVLRHDAQGVHAARFWQSNPALPIATPSEASHPLARKAGQIVTNHPSVFSVQPGPDVVYEFAKGEGVVVAGDLDEGRFVALADPSVLINGMLAFQGNLAFAVNLVKFLVPTDTSKPARIIVLNGDFHLYGEPPGALDDPHTGTMNGILGDLGKFFDELNDYVAPAGGLRNGARLAGFLVLLGGIAYALLRRARDPDAGFARVDPARAGYEAAVEDFDRNGATNYALPAAALRENFEIRVAELVGPDAELPAAALARKLADVRALRVPAADAQRLIERLRQVPVRTMLLARPFQMGERDFIDLQDAVAASFALKDDHGHPGN